MHLLPRMTYIFASPGMLYLPTPIKHTRGLCRGADSELEETDACNLCHKAFVEEFVVSS